MVISFLFSERTQTKGDNSPIINAGKNVNIYYSNTNKNIDLFRDILKSNNIDFISQLLNTKPIKTDKDEIIWRYNDILISYLRNEKQVTFLYNVNKSIQKYPVTRFNVESGLNIIFGKSKFSELLKYYNLNKHRVHLQGESSAGGVYVSTTIEEDYVFYTFGTTKPSEIYGPIANGTFYPPISFLKKVANNLFNFIIVSKNKNINYSPVYDLNYFDNSYWNGE